MNGYLLLGWLFLIIGLACWANVLYSLYLLFRTKLIIELPLNQKFKNFTVRKKGGYAIWQEGPLFKQAPVTFSRPQIINTEQNDIVKLSASKGRATKNGFSRGSSLIFYCELELGHYCFEVEAGSSLHTIEDKISQSVIKQLDIQKAPVSQYCFQIRESLTKKQRIMMVICIFAGLFFFLRGLFTILHLMLGLPMEGSLA